MGAFSLCRSTNTIASPATSKPWFAARAMSLVAPGAATSMSPSSSVFPPPPIPVARTPCRCVTIPAPPVSAVAGPSAGPDAVLLNKNRVDDQESRTQRRSSATLSLDSLKLPQSFNSHPFSLVICFDNITPRRISSWLVSATVAPCDRAPPWNPICQNLEKSDSSGVPSQPPE